jgi:hypothetical protein
MLTCEGIQIHDEENEPPSSIGQPCIPLLAPARIFDGLADLCLGVAIRTAQLLELHVPSSYYGLNDGPESARNAERRLKVWLCERLVRCTDPPLTTLS